MKYKIEERYISNLNMNITFYIGKNAAGNFDIIDMSKPNDMWFHINNISSAHVIASIPDKLDKKDIRYIIKQGAILCKQHSKTHESTIIYTTINNVKKTDIIGSVIITNDKIIKI
jgi:predicted ribosome quality control (RQC) complex YloA/Tae2 family protein